MSVESSKVLSPFVIFLDIDGVLCGRLEWNAVFEKSKQLFSPETYLRKRELEVAATHFFSQESLKNLDILIEEIKKTREVKIVISSSWRMNKTTEELKRIFGKHNFSNYIVDKLPDESPLSFLSRAAQIQCWLRRHPEISSFVILDDRDEDLSSQFRGKFFQTDYQTLLTSEIVERILRDSCPSLTGIS